MKHQQLEGKTPPRRFIAVFEIGDDVLAQLQEFCETQRITAAAVCGVGGFERVTVGYYDMQAKRYEPIVVDEQVEVLSFLGNVTSYQDKPKVHVHCVVGHRNGRTTGGHLIAATVRPTLELIVEEISPALRRTDRPEIGIPLIDV